MFIGSNRKILLWIARKLLRQAPRLPPCEQRDTNGDFVKKSMASPEWTSESCCQSDHRGRRDCPKGRNCPEHKVGKCPDNHGVRQCSYDPKCSYVLPKSCKSCDSLRSTECQDLELAQAMSFLSHNGFGSDKSHDPHRSSPRDSYRGPHHGFGSDESHDPHHGSYRGPHPDPHHGFGSDESHDPHHGSYRGPHSGSPRDSHRGSPPDLHSDPYHGSHFIFGSDRPHDPYRDSPRGSHHGLPRGSHHGSPPDSHRSVHRGSYHGSHRGSPRDSHRGSPRDLHDELITSAFLQGVAAAQQAAEQLVPVRDVSSRYSLGHPGYHPHPGIPGLWMLDAPSGTRSGTRYLPRGGGSP